MPSGMNLVVVKLGSIPRLAARSPSVVAVAMARIVPGGCIANRELDCSIGGYGFQCGGLESGGSPPPHSGRHTCTHSRAYTPAHTRVRMHTRARTPTPTPTGTHAHTRPHAHTHTCSRAFTFTHTYTHGSTHARVRPRTCTHAFAHAHAQALVCVVTR